MTKVEKAVSLLRDFINNSWVKQRVMKRNRYWSQLCSSMDVIEDCEQGIEAYRLTGLNSTVGLMYLAVYGVLQALYVQQDAIRNLGGAFGTRVNYHGVKEIRDLRNSCVGHPTKMWDKSSHAISRPTLTNKGFQLISHYVGEKTAFRNISIPEFISKQRQWAIRMINEILKIEKEKYKAHKKKFKLESVVLIFPKTIDWHLSKIFENVSGEPKIGIVHLDQVYETIRQFKLALAKREICLEDDVYENIYYPMKQIRLFLKAKIAGRSLPWDVKAVEIFAWYLNNQIKDLRDTHAREVDAEYSK